MGTGPIDGQRFCPVKCFQLICVTAAVLNAAISRISQPALLMPAT